MGIESYGLVGVYSSLLTMFALLDMGLSGAINREMARRSALQTETRQMRDLTRTLEVIYWCIAVLIGGAVIALAGPIAHHWVKPDRLSPEVVQQAITIMGFVLALRWPVSLYSGALVGLQRQMGLNIVTSACATFRGCGALMVLWWIEPSIRAFFLFQIAASALETSALVVYLWVSLPAGEHRARFNVQRLSEVWRFSALMAGTGVFVMILTNTDKIILSKMLSLEQFGYYTLAWAVASILYRIAAPLVSAVYPQMTQLVALRDEERLKHLYHKASQTMSVLLVPAGVVLAIFSEKVLFLWSGDSSLAHNTAPILSILAVGVCLNGFMYLPYHAQLAHGWVSLAFWINVVATVFLAPLIVLCTTFYGPVGAAAGWVALNCGYIVFGIGLMHRRILKNEKRTWYVHDVGLPTAAAILAGLLAYWIVPPTLPRLAIFGYLVFAGGLCLSVTAMAAPVPRDLVLTRIVGFVKRQGVWQY